MIDKLNSLRELRNIYDDTWGNKNIDTTGNKSIHILSSNRDILKVSKSCQVQTAVGCMSDAQSKSINQIFPKRWDIVKVYTDIKFF